MMIDPREILPVGIRAALAAGEKILEVYNSDDFDVSLKDDDSPLTRADLLAQKTITTIVENAFPDIPFLGEEGGKTPFSERSAWETFWLVDPLDGTKEFVKRNGEFTVNIALVRDGRPALGILYVPVKDMLYYASAGCGAHKVEGAAAQSADTGIDGLMGSAARLPLDTDRTVPPVVVVASRSHFSDDTKSFVDALKAEHGEIELINAGSALKICLVAEGRADVYPRFGPTMEWDVGAGQIIAEEAGCSVINPDTGTALRYNKENLLNPYFVVTGDALQGKTAVN
ncbi:MAG: 3'(2'),5'-bisphosphate nucleotidase CysQ [Spirochaetales bacterium]|jgi:3'(2'), 5'-bisphosphate nucleotidase|nr:3'(2'),5'-bisphosphate nucleotidase CysQ [Spirochaetales bacterium]